MQSFQLTIPKTLAAAVTALGDDAIFKAAGIDLLDRLKERKERFANLVDLTRLPAEMGGISKDGSRVRIGALATLHQIEQAASLQSTHLTALREAAGEAATPQVRRRATLGGNLLQRARCWYLRGAGFGCAHGGDGPTCLAREGENRYHAILDAFDCVRVHPSNTATALCALRATAHITGKNGKRTIPVRELWPPFGLAALAEHTLAPDEVLTAIELDASTAFDRSAYRESREKVSFDWPTVAAAVAVKLDGARVADVSICLGAVSPTPHVAEEAAALLRGKAPTPAVLDEVVSTAFAKAQPLAHNAYKIAQGKAVLRDTLVAALGKETVDGR
ncbi:MAG: xanthine dehydrogenase family protein subunit M [Planctomycetota bacterium]